MSHCLTLHDAVVRASLANYNGYEVTTEGDALVLAFHSAAEAIHFCFEVQMDLLQTSWPRELLRHSKCAIVASKDTDSTANRTLMWPGRKSRARLNVDKLVKLPGADESDRFLRIFGGLRVRMAIDYSYCAHSVHEVTGRYAYSGEAMVGCKAILGAVQSGVRSWRAGVHW